MDWSILQRLITDHWAWYEWLWFNRSACWCVRFIQLPQISLHEQLIAQQFFPGVHLRSQQSSISPGEQGWLLRWTTNLRVQHALFAVLLHWWQSFYWKPPSLSRHWYAIFAWTARTLQFVRRYHPSWFWNSSVHDWTACIMQRGFVMRLSTCNSS